MFVRAIEDISRFTKPIHSIMRLYPSNHVMPGSATLFFVNDNGVAITCRHVAEQILQTEHINQQYLLFSQRRFRLKNDEHYDNNLKDIEGEFNFRDNSIVQMKQSFLGCFDKITSLDCHLHPTQDLAILVFKGFTKILYQGHARFKSEDNDVRQGKQLCRLGFPFPEFNNFKYNYKTDEIEWTKEGNAWSPSFPIDGIVTRMLAPNGKIVGIEMSSPGLRGQSGGPLFDHEGVIYGMQSSTKHLHLGFDLVDYEIPFGSEVKKVSNSPFLHVGQCVHASVIKEFLRLHNVEFFED